MISSIGLDQGQVVAQFGPTILLIMVVDLSCCQLTVIIEDVCAQFVRSHSSFQEVVGRKYGLGFSVS